MRSENRVRVWPEVFVWGLLFSLFLSERVQALTDMVVLKNGEQAKGKVEKDEIGGITLAQTTGGSIQFKSGEIREINWDLRSKDWSDGIKEYKNGQFESAAEFFKNIIDDEALLKEFREVARPYLIFMAGDAFFQSGKASEALTYFEKLLANYKNSRYVPMAISQIVVISIRLKKFDRANEMLGKLRESGQKGRADYFSGELAYAQGDVKKAGSFFNAASMDIDEEINSLARLGQARCAVKLKNLDQAMDMAQRALSSTSAIPAPVASAAHTIIGDVLFERAGEANKEQLMDAILEYLRVPILYPGHLETEPKALFQAGECFRKLAKMGVKTDIARARALYSEVIGKFPSSIWAEKARESIKTLK